MDTFGIFLVGSNAVTPGSFFQLCYSKRMNVIMYGMKKTMTKKKPMKLKQQAAKAISMKKAGKKPTKPKY